MGQLEAWERIRRGVAPRRCAGGLRPSHEEAGRWRRLQVRV